MNLLLEPFITSPFCLWVEISAASLMEKFRDVLMEKLYEIKCFVEMEWQENVG